MATDRLILSGLSGLALIVSALGWESGRTDQARVVHGLAPGLVALSDMPCPLIAKPKIIHSNLEPQNLLPPIVRSRSA
jgi:hypothetical protein